MKKTAMMKLIEELDKVYDGIKNESEVGRLAISGAIRLAKNHLPTERQNIEEAYRVGFDNGKDDVLYDKDKFNPDFFTQTYEQK